MPVPPPLLNGRVRELTLGMLFESGPVAQTPGLRHLLGLPLPPWQRPEVWTLTQKQKFVEGLFLGFAPGQYVVNGQDWDSQTADPLPCSGWLLDGQQRISALRDFVQGDLVVFGDVTYGGLSKAEQLRFMRKPFPCFELHPRTGRGPRSKRVGRVSGPGAKPPSLSAGNARPRSRPSSWFKSLALNGPMTVERRKITYKLYPTAAQSAVLARLLEAHRLLYNAALEERISAWRFARKSISFEDQTQSLTQVRGLLPEDWAWVNCSAQQVTLRRLSKAFQAFFARCKKGQAPGFPRFKSTSRMPGFGYKGHGDGWRFTPGETGRHGTLRLQEVGHIRARGQSRFDLTASKIKSCELLHEHGQWHLSLTVECAPVRAGGDKVGAADWGVSTLLTIVDDAGVSEVVNPRHSRTGMERQVELQQRVSRAKRGSKGWKRACKALRCFKRRQARQRLDAQHQLSARIAGEYFAFGMEKLTVKNMTASAAGTVEEPGKNVQQKAGLNREILDTAPARLMALISYKVQETGGWFMEAPTRQLKPSQRCPSCGHVHKKALSERTHACAQCGHTEPRDVASARIVYAWLREQLEAKDTGQELPRWCSSTPETATIAPQALGGR